MERIMHLMTHVTVESRAWAAAAGRALVSALFGDRWLRRDSFRRLRPPTCRPPVRRSVGRCKGIIGHCSQTFTLLPDHAYIARTSLFTMMR